MREHFFACSYHLNKEKSVYLVFGKHKFKYRDLISIIDSYKDIDDYKLIFKAKLDEPHHMAIC